MVQDYTIRSQMGVPSGLKLTNADKKRLIDALEKKKEKKIHELQKESERMSKVCKDKMMRRLNSVSVTLWDIKLRDVLDLERRNVPSMKSLLQDIKQMKESIGDDCAG